jgi:hypothetical protein
MKKYNAKLLSLSTSIEEEVTVDIAGSVIVGFSTVCPYKISANNIYPVELGLTFLEGEEIDEVSEEKYGLERVGDTYQYMLFGKVSDGAVDIGKGIKIADEYFKVNTYLEGSFVKVAADRITIDFLPVS